MTITGCMEFYLERAKYNYEMADVYSWKRWGSYNRLRLHRAHNYLEHIIAVLTGVKAFNKHNLARIGGRGAWLSDSCLSADYLARHNAYCLAIGWERHCISMDDVDSAYRPSQNITTDEEETKMRLRDEAVKKASQMLNAGIDSQIVIERLFNDNNDYDALFDGMDDDERFQVAHDVIVEADEEYLAIIDAIDSAKGGMANDYN